MNYGKWIEKKRRRLGYTQESLAEIVGVTDRTIRRIESGKVPKKETRTMKKLCEVLNIDLESILRNQRVSNEEDSNDLYGLTAMLGYSNMDDLAGSVKERLEWGMKALKEGSYEKALPVMKAGAEFLSNNYLYLICADIYRKLKQPDKVKEVCDKITYTRKELESDSKIAFVKMLILAENYLYCNCTLKAAEFYQACFKYEGDLYPVYIGLARCVYNNWTTEEMLSYVEKAIELNPGKCEGYLLRGNYYRFIGEMDKAIEQYRKSLEISADNLESLLGIGICLFAKRQPYEAMLYFKTMFQLYFNVFFDSQNKQVQKQLFIDIGLEETHVIGFEYDGMEQVYVDSEEDRITISLKQQEANIFIGTVQLDSKDVNTKYPIVGKLYEDVKEYQQAISMIQSHVDLFKWFEEERYIDTNKKVKVEITEREEDVEILMEFDVYKIFGLAKKREGFESFVTAYTQCGQCLIHLESGEKVFEIDCISDVKLNLLSTDQLI